MSSSVSPSVSSDSPPVRPESVRWAKGLEWLTQPWVALLTCLLAGFLSYAPALGGDLIWDDLYLVKENPFFRSPVFGLEVFRHYLFFDSFSIYYRPVQNWSYMLDYWLWHGSPAGYHLTNILLHSLSGFLLFLVLTRLLPDLGFAAGGKERPVPGTIAWLVALVWVVHPIHNAAVAYISGRADSLAALFALGAWWLCLRAVDSDSRNNRGVLAILAAVSMLVALCSKEIALMWLLLLLLHRFAFAQPRSDRAKWFVLAGTLAVFAAYAVLHALPGYRAPMQNGPPEPWDTRVLLMFRALGDYTGLIFFPDRLYMERSLSDPGIYRSVTIWREHIRYEYLSVIGLLALLAALYGCTRRGPVRQVRLFGAAWFFIAFLPISNLFPLNAEVAEHWIYLASIGFLLFLAGVVLLLPARGRQFCAIVVCLAVVGLGIRTAWRSGDWVDAETFCARTIASGGGSPRLYSSLAAVYAQRGDYEKQERVLRRMIAEFPDFMPARMNLGICLSRQGKTTEAEPFLQTTHAQADENSRLYPKTWPGILQLAQLRRDAHHSDEALAMVREARTRFPEVWELAKSESTLLAETSGPDAGIPVVEGFVRDHWWHSDARFTLGQMLFSTGRSDEAIAALQEASRFDLYDGRALSAMAEIESARGRNEAALDDQLEALARDPDEPRGYLALSGILEKLGRKQEAEAALRKAQILASQAQKRS